MKLIPDPKQLSVNCIHSLEHLVNIGAFYLGVNLVTTFLLNQNVLKHHSKIVSYVK